jgi:hypothetical protein
MSHNAIILFEENLEMLELGMMEYVKNRDFCK